MRSISNYKLRWLLIFFVTGVINVDEHTRIASEYGSCRQELMHHNQPPISRIVFKIYLALFCAFTF